MSLLLRRTRSGPCLRYGLAATLAVVLAPVALAQEATNTPAATQPSVGKWYLREKVQYFKLGDDPSPEKRDIDKIVATTTLAYGITRDLSASLELPLVLSFEDPAGSAGTDTDFGANDLSLSFKWRPFQWDLNPVDSVRLAFFGGVESPTGSGDFGSHSWDPFVGTVFTAILGRHGFNQSLSYKFNTGGDRFNTRAGDGPDDALRYDTAYLFRLETRRSTPRKPPRRLTSRLNSTVCTRPAATTRSCSVPDCCTRPGPSRSRPPSDSPLCRTCENAPRPTSSSPSGSGSCSDDTEEAP